MTTFKDMPLDTTLQKGDIVTITGPGEHDVTTREITQKLTFVEILTKQGISASEIRNNRKLAVRKVQRPVPALPTVEGDYMLTLSNGYRSVVSLRDGAWLNGLSDPDDVQWLTARVEEGATLTRVIPADEVKRPVVDMAAATSAFLDLWVASTGSVKGDFKTVLLRVLAGEFDL